jgi:hypothetical protein
MYLRPPLPVRSPLGQPFWNRLERSLLSAGLSIVALIADWLLARRLAHDRKQQT